MASIRTHPTVFSDNDLKAQTPVAPSYFDDNVHAVDQEVRFPTRWSKIRHHIREPFAEFLGTLILILFGTGVNAQATLSGSTAVSAAPQGSSLSGAFGWAVGIALGAWVSGGISGGHINPAVTITMATFRGFPWKKVPIYILAQIVGAVCGAGIVYANYHTAIDLYEGGRGIRTVPGTAALFGTYASPYMTNVSCFFEEFMVTAILLITIFAVTDKRNGPPPNGLIPLVLFITLLGISAAFGMQTSFALNPARDFGPRLLTYMVGYGREVWNYRRQYWIWTPVLATTSGALFGAFIYDVMLYTGTDSIINKPRGGASSHSDQDRVSDAV
ncbi:hypothetical protein BOTBODRAFT_172164 [Botryobasidium botryosum FD-172 SS1]|uniref:Aquaporin n=1 Tax=Botryobasidium botryosum (strain FD-172 SS1) TaxID=930990 RepID=A0A067N0Q2_BOTB1|nr:hypothetical protein BOTBODRAFT_172164 [Botryobasidium botryosum FD-172 SS1]